MDEILEDLYNNKIIQFGQFVLKSGKTSPIYIDLRSLVSFLDAREKIGIALSNAIIKSNVKFDYIIGVPYGAILLAEHVARLLDKPVLLIRKEAKTYGKKEMIIGHFEQGKKTLVIEDVVSTGSSILETVEEINKAGLVTEHVFCVVDREQGGPQRLGEKRLELHSLIQMTTILNFLVTKKIIDLDKKEEIIKQLIEQNTSSESSIQLLSSKEHQFISLQKRLELFSKNSINCKLINLMLKKKSNLCLAVDNFTKDEILKIVDKAKNKICALKLHCDTIDDWNIEFALKLRKIADENDFLIFEDRKLADTGNTMLLQLTKGLKIANWADVVTAYPFPGIKTFETLKEIINSPKYQLSGILLLAELSTEGSKMDKTLSIELAQKLGNELICGFICQKKCLEENNNFIYWTPGINLNKSQKNDGKGQKWREPSQALLNDFCDILIVGRGITEAENIEKEIEKYSEICWNILINRS